MSENHQEKSLDFPFMASIPYEVLVSDLEPAAKIYFGCLVGLSVNQGYCYATDDQLAEMQKVSLATIERWNTNLRELEFISMTKTYEIKKSASGKKFPKPKRKIFINKAFQKKNTKPLKTRGTKKVVTLKNEGHQTLAGTPQKRGDTNKNKDISENNDKQQTEKKVPAAPIIIFFDQDDERIKATNHLKLGKTVMKEILNHPIEKINEWLAIAQEYPLNDHGRIFTTAMRKDWSKAETKAQTALKEAEAQALIEEHYRKCRKRAEEIIKRFDGKLHYNFTARPSERFVTISIAGTSKCQFLNYDDEKTFQRLERLDLEYETLKK